MWLRWAAVAAGDVAVVRRGSAGATLGRSALLAAVLVSLFAVHADVASASVVIGPAQPVAGASSLVSFGCASASQCFAVGGGTAGDVGVVVPFVDGVAGTAQQVTGSEGLSGVACADANTCFAGGFTRSGGALGVQVQISGGAARAAQTVPGAVGEFDGEACDGGTECVAVLGSGTEGGVLPVSSGVAEGFVPVPGTGALGGVACPKVGTCMAVGTSTISMTASGAGVVVPIDGGVPGAVEPVAGTATLNGIACADASVCFAVGTSPLDNGTPPVTQGVLVPILDGTPGSVQAIAGTTALVAVACASGTSCFAVGEVATATGQTQLLIPIDVAARASGSPQTIPGDEVLSGIGCASASSCVAVGTSSSSGAVSVALAVAGSIGPPTTTIATPAAGTSYALDDPSLPAYSFTCQPPLAGTLSSCAATVDGAPVTDGQPIDTSSAGSRTLTVTATDADGQNDTATSTYTIAMGDQTIFFPQVGPLKYAHPPVTLTATASSGLPVAYGVASGPCSISGSTLTLSGSGPCVVTADQAGSANYHAAPQVSSTISVDAPTPPTCSAQTASAANAGAVRIALDCADAPGDDGDPLSFTTGPPAHGTLADLDQTTGEVTYAPGGGYVGPDAFTVTAKNTQGTSIAATVSIDVAQQLPPANTAPPVISGTLQSGQVLSCDPGAWSGGAPQTYAYRWERDGSPIAEATAADYATQSADQGHTLLCSVTATNAGGSAAADSAGAPIPAPAAIVRKPAISGTRAPGRRLTCASGTWSGTAPLTYSYQWRRVGAAIAGATASTHIVAVADVGASLTCVVTATNSLGSVSAVSAAVVVPGSNAFTFGKPKAGAGGSITIKVTAPAAGRFVAAAKSYGADTVSASRAGSRTLTIRPRKAAVTLLEQRGRLRVVVSVTFTPRGGKSRSKTTSITV
jgi:Big-like domain-containing protein